jgi:hypothetical protein
VGEEASRPEVPTDGIARPWSSSWVNYYDQASRRRHRMGGYRRLRALARKKHRIELATMAVATMGLMALFSVFCAILTR